MTQEELEKWVQQVMRDFDKGAKLIGGISFITAYDAVDDNGNFIFMS